ncbi:unnamed protein product [Vitrella brassicaformis CCMP3155]|uniref:Uncharacterized protein n=1 Tax=Vitrella brassicaformis (strain CCMP3155) TaxID=1169540 RepID=A0A0G4ELC5_VITBC|nr:unnamed protein product [Vitrella brassicaformis CCMP3155]|eukprot:CEL97521.1 unnamed protein product [Vitrella brassicaformis CCMP3155]
MALHCVVTVTMAGEGVPQRCWRGRATEAAADRRLHFIFWCLMPCTTSRCPTAHRLRRALGAIRPRSIAWMPSVVNCRTPFGERNAHPGLSTYCSAFFS